MGGVCGEAEVEGGLMGVYEETHFLIRIRCDGMHMDDCDGITAPGENGLEYHHVLEELSGGRGGCRVSNS